MIAAIVVSFLIGLASSHTRIKNDTAIGVFFVGAFALGIAVISTQRTYTRDLTSFLIGSILGFPQRSLSDRHGGSDRAAGRGADSPRTDVDRLRSSLFPR